MVETTRFPVLAVLGGADATTDEEATAEAVAALAARRGWVVITGGGPGVMAAACRGAVEAGGVAVGRDPVVACPDPSARREWREHARNQALELEVVASQRLPQAGAR